MNDTTQQSSLWNNHDYNISNTTTISITNGNHQKSHWRYTKWIRVIPFLLIDCIAVIFLQWAVNLSNTAGAIWEFFYQTVTVPNRIILLNLLILAIIHLTIITLFNRLWWGSALFLTLVAIISVADRIKVEVRNQTILPSDLSFVSSGDGNSLLSFIPSGCTYLITIIGIFIILFWVIAFLLTEQDNDHGRLFHKNTSVGNKKLVHQCIRVISQGLLIALAVGTLVSFTNTLGTSGEWGNTIAEAFNDNPALWDSVVDAQYNGTLISFLRLVHVTIMREPANYSQATMESIAKEYTELADSINETRTQQLTNMNVIAILSESYSDPLRVPGITLNKDPMPYIRSLNKTATTGLMLSSGYGGGTANLEYQELTGLSMANFNASLTSPYQQLVPQEKWTPSFNQLWNTYASGSLGFHPYLGSLYQRETNYRNKFDFQHFWTLDGPEYIDTIACTTKIDQDPYVSDQCAYDSVLNTIEKETSGTRFYQLEIMQNHMPYNEYYSHNPYIVTATNGQALSTAEKEQIKTYVDGLSYTDKAVQEFLTQLNKINKPITVIWYGDHLPGIYSTAAANSKNMIALHETNYFIWSNKASYVIDNGKLPASESAYTSPNFFMAEAAEQTNSKVSPYLAFLTQLHTQIAAIEPAIADTQQTWNSLPAGEALYLNSSGQQITTNMLTSEDKTLLEQYKLIQYDITCGKNYLKSLGFMDLPETSQTTVHN